MPDIESTLSIAVWAWKENLGWANSSSMFMADLMQFYLKETHGSLASGNWKPLPRRTGSFLDGGELIAIVLR